MDPVSTTNAIVQLTSEQISSLMQERIFGLIISIVLIVIGGLAGTKIRNEFGRVFGLILTLSGAIGTIGFTLALLNLSTQMI
ncbi:MAG: hypothetical protein NTZ83_00975 [Candidatus Pacearchaeota archaeon]|nr:hypothetical protein [Candidatus Pacearchaeota archaeon]